MTVWPSRVDRAPGARRLVAAAAWCAWACGTAGALAQTPRSHDTIDMREAFAPPASAAASASPSRSASSPQPALIGPGADGPLPRLLQTEPPRDTARHIGDVLPYRALISWPDGWAIDRDGLPDTSGAERPIELRSHTLEPAHDHCADCRWLTLNWQLFKGPRSSEDQHLAATPVRLRRGAQVVTLELPAAVLAVSPLVPWDGRRNWLDSVRPGWRPLPFDTHARYAEAALSLGLGAFALVVWAWASGRLSFGGGRRPFARAWRALRARRLNGQRPADADADATDLRLWHRAFDATAGEVVFIETLDAFLAARPGLAPWGPAVREVFTASRQRFFIDAEGAPGHGPSRGELIALLGHLAQAEFVAATAARPPSEDAQDHASDGARASA